MDSYHSRYPLRYYGVEYRASIEVDMSRMMLREKEV